MCDTFPWLTANGETDVETGDDDDLITIIARGV
jgi:hypothetical protein